MVGPGKEKKIFLALVGSGPAVILRFALHRPLVECLLIQTIPTVPTFSVGRSGLTVSIKQESMACVCRYTAV